MIYILLEREKTWIVYKLVPSRFLVLEAYFEMHIRILLNGYIGKRTELAFLTEKNRYENWGNAKKNKN